MEIIPPLVQEAGKRLMDFFQKENLSIKQKSINNPVTEADYAANSILVQGLLKHFPQDAILSEENSLHFDKKEMEAKRKKERRVWIIDPLDGTKEFIEGLPHFAVSLALWQEGEAALGFIYNPAEEFFLYGGKDLSDEKTSGLFLNGKPFAFSRQAPSSLTEMRFCFSRSEIKKGLMDSLFARIPNIKKVALGSIAYKLAMLASGQCDLVISFKPKNEWDFAAGMALLEASGQKVYNLDFQKISLNQENPLVPNLICGTQTSINLYKDFIEER